jgi:hypothetical protein
MTESTFHIQSPADLLALVPCVLGFHPQDSLVLVAVGETGGGLHARVDLTPDEDDLRAGIGCLLAAVLRNRGRSVALVAYTDDPVVAEEVVDRLDDALYDHGVQVLSAIRADGSRWYDLLCDDEGCCPGHGEPYDLSSHPITAQAVLDGQVTLGSRQELVDSLVGTDTDDLEAVADAADEAMRSLRATARRPGGADAPGPSRGYLVAEGHWVRDRVRRYLATREPLDAAEVARMAVAMADIQVRDVAWSEISRDDVQLHVELWRDLVRRTPLDLLAAPAALLGFAAWLSGDGALAWCAIERCQQAEPDYSMAQLLSTALTSAVPPSTWMPIPPEEVPLFAG